MTSLQKEESLYIMHSFSHFKASGGPKIFQKIEERLYWFNLAKVAKKQGS